MTAHNLRIGSEIVIYAESDIFSKEFLQILVNHMARVVSLYQEDERRRIIPGLDKELERLNVKLHEDINELGVDITPYKVEPVSGGWTYETAPTGLPVKDKGDGAMLGGPWTLSGAREVLDAIKQNKDRKLKKAIKIVGSSGDSAEDVQRLIRIFFLDNIQLKKAASDALGNMLEGEGQSTVVLMPASFMGSPEGIAMPAAREINEELLTSVEKALWRERYFEEPDFHPDYYIALNSAREKIFGITRRIPMPAELSIEEFRADKEAFERSADGAMLSIKKKIAIIDWLRILTDGDDKMEINIGADEEIGFRVPVVEISFFLEKELGMISNGFDVNGNQIFTGFKFHTLGSHSLDFERTDAAMRSDSVKKSLFGRIDQKLFGQNVPMEVRNGNIFINGMEMPRVNTTVEHDLSHFAIDRVTHSYVLDRFAAESLYGEGNVRLPGNEKRANTEEILTILLEDYGPIFLRNGPEAARKTVDELNSRDFRKRYGVTKKQFYNIENELQDLRQRVRQGETINLTHRIKAEVKPKADAAMVGAAGDEAMLAFEQEMGEFLSENKIEFESDEQKIVLTRELLLNMDFVGQYKEKDLRPNILNVLKRNGVKKPGIILNKLIKWRKQWIGNFRKAYQQESEQLFQEVRETSPSLGFNVAIKPGFTEDERKQLEGAIFWLVSKIPSSIIDNLKKELYGEMYVYGKIDYKGSRLGELDFRDSTSFDYINFSHPSKIPKILNKDLQFYQPTGLPALILELVDDFTEPLKFEEDDSEGEEDLIQHLQAIILKDLARMGESQSWKAQQIVRVLQDLINDEELEARAPHFTTAIRAELFKHIKRMAMNLKSTEFLSVDDYVDHHLTDILIKNVFESAGLKEDPKLPGYYSRGDGAMLTTRITTSANAKKAFEFLKNYKRYNSHDQLATDIDFIEDNTVLMYGGQKAIKYASSTKGYDQPQVERFEGFDLFFHGDDVILKTPQKIFGIYRPSEEIQLGQKAFAVEEIPEDMLFFSMKEGVSNLLQITKQIYDHYKDAEKRDQLLHAPS